VKQFEISAIALVMCAVIGCVGPDPVLKAALDQQIAQIRSRTTVYSAPKAAIPMPLKVGQWIQTKGVDESGNLALTTIKLVGQEGESFWQETVSQTAYGSMTIRALINFGDLTDPNTKKVLRVQMKDTDGHVTEYPTGAVDFMRSLGPSISSASWKGLLQEDVQVPAGRFVQCYKGPLSITTLLGTTTGSVWWHSGVPINGIVKSVGHGGVGGGTVELIALGLEGAKSEF